MYVLHIPQQIAIKGYEVQGHHSPGLWTNMSEINKGVVFARSGSKPEACSYNSYHEESRNIKCARNNVTVDNQAYVDIDFLNQNDSYNNILRCGTPYLEYTVLHLLNAYIPIP
jgi:hypothetical protein